MNIRSLTRGDGVVIGAAVLLFIASFLDLSDALFASNAWDQLGLGFGVYLGGVIGAALVVTARLLPQPRKVAGLELGTVGTVLAVSAAWVLLWTLIDAVSAGAGLILGFLAALVIAAAAVATPLVPALQAGLVPAPRPAAPQPYGAQPQGGYGYPGAQPQPFGGQPQQGQPYAGQVPQAPQDQQPAAPFSPFWFAVPGPRPLYAEDGSPAQIAELSPGVWYLAVEQRGAGLLTEMQDGRRGVLQDASNIQRG
ncbi:hypothetical protein ABZ920_24985 [Streptomyces sp. NPDC046831]|uniref:DUF5336 domain-containing protein n=1 Tax=Streptomyces sp. NPDC046831 TaxID=3154805 RepID=UPI0033E4C09C